MSRRVYSITQHCTAVYCIYSGIEWHFQWPQKFFWRIIFTDSFGQNISVPYFGKFSHLELPDNIGRIRSLHFMLFLCCSLCFNSVNSVDNNKILTLLLPTKATVHCSIYDRNHRYACDLRPRRKQERKSIMQHSFGGKWCLWNECDTSTESECLFL